MTWKKRDGWVAELVARTTLPNFSSASDDAEVDTTSQIFVLVESSDVTPGGRDHEYAWGGLRKIGKALR